MNKLHLLKQAENLYCIENLTPEIIVEKLNISRRTVFNWKKKYKWDNHLVRIKDFSNQFTTEIYSVGAKILSKLNDDIENHSILNKHEICALENIIQIIYKEEKGQTKNLDNFSPKKKSVKFLTPDVIEEINSEILGWNGTY